MSKVSGNAIDVSILKRIYRYLKPYQKQFYLAIFLTVLLAVIAPIRPYLVQYTIDEFVLKNNSEGLLMMVGVLFIALAFQTIVQYFHTVITNWLGQSAILDLRKLIFDHLML